MTNSLFTLQTTSRPGSSRDGISLCSSPNVASPPAHDTGGGGERDRTDDLLLAKQALSQLSYTPGPEVRDQNTEISFV
jgi:hypothetical protein